MYKILKYSFDIGFSLVGFLLLSPLFVVIIIILRFSGEGEIFYLQKRMGYNNKIFSIYKFASMLKNSPNIGSKTITTRKDPRITPIGKYLRITKLNELPQIINVIKGDMSLVGPRPLLITSFAKHIPKVQEILYKNKPGITGISSLLFRDEEKLVTTFKNLAKDPMDYYKQYIYPYKGQLEIWYYSNISFLTDFKILLLTFWSLFDANSNIAYKFFKDLPPKPFELTLEGIKSLK